MYAALWPKNKKGAKILIVVEVKRIKKVAFLNLSLENSSNIFTVKVEVNWIYYVAKVVKIVFKVLI